MLILLINRTEKKRNIENISLRVYSSCGYGTGTYVVDEQTSDSFSRHDTTPRISNFNVKNSLRVFQYLVWCGTYVPS